MKEYKRLQELMFKDRQTYIDEHGEYWAVGNIDNYTGSVKGIAIDKLAELEDKIENGTLVELPCKVGDTMYKICPQSKFLKFGDMWDGRKVEHPCQKCGWYGCVCHDIGFQKDWDNIVQEREMKSLEYIIRIMPYVGTIWFTTKAEAEEKLTELENER